MTSSNDISISQYYLTPAEQRPDLTAHQFIIAERVGSLIALMDQHTLTKDQIDVHMAIEKAKGHAISMATAYRDMAIAKEIRGEMENIDRKYERIAMANWQKKMMAKAAELNDMMGFNRGMANVIKILGLDREDPIPIDYSAFKPVLTVFGFFPDILPQIDLPPDEELLEILAELEKPEKYKKKRNGEYINFEEVDNG